MKSPVAFALVLTLAPAPAAAQQEVEAIVKRVQAVPATSTKSDCDAQVAKAARANAFDLFYGAGVCGAAKQKPESSFLLLAAQIRAMPDMDLMMPAAQADAKKVIALYGFIYSYAGGMGDEEVLRDKAERERLYLLLNQWKPPYDASYDPGWATRQRPSEAEYRATLEESAVERRRQLEEIVRLYSDDVYYSLHRQERDLYAKQGGPVVAGSPAARQLSDLARKMNDRGVALGPGNAPKEIPIDEAGAHQPSIDEPPDAPGSDERIIDGSNDPVVKRCVKGAEFMDLLSNARIARVLITTTKKWGTVWRADLEGGTFGSERRVCTVNYDGSRPLDMGPKDRLAPLPAAPAKTAN